MAGDLPSSERRQATILFADISGFTSMSERLDPEAVTALMDECFVLLGSIVDEEGGAIDKFIGDCVMALFGAPKALEDAPSKAIAAALRMREAMEGFAAAHDPGLALGIHIGINSGEVLAGGLGSSRRKDFTVMGDAVNLASRLKDLAKKGQIFVGPLTWRDARNSYRFVALKPLEVKGKTAPVQAYEVLGRAGAGTGSVSGAAGVAGAAGVGTELDGEQMMVQSPLVGRGTELDLLKERLALLRGGRGSVINLVGEAGVGKSRLCAELFSSEAARGIGILEGRAIASGRTLSYYPVNGVLRSWAGIGEDSGEEEAADRLEAAIREVAPETVEEIAPYLAAPMGLGSLKRYSSFLEGMKGEAFGQLVAKAFKDLLSAVSARNPILLVIDDLHWADESSLELLEALLPLAAKHPLAFLCIWRPGYKETVEAFHSFVAANLPELLVDVELSPLEPRLAGELAQNLLKGSGVNGDLIARIGEKTGGNPFFIEEVVRSFIDAGIVKAGKPGFDADASLDSLEIPDSIDAVIMARVDRLDEAMKSLLRMASVIGRSFFLRILALVAGGEGELGQRLEALKALQLIRERSRLDEVEYLFKHVLVQETIYRSILLRNRKELHLRVARAIEESFPDRLSEFYGLLAWHYIQGEDADRAAEYLEKAGKAALESASSSEALVFYQKALAIYREKSGGKVPPERLAELERNIGRAFHAKGRFREAVEHYDTALASMGQARLGPAGESVVMLAGFASFLVYAWIPPTRSKKKPGPREVFILETLSDKLFALLIMDVNAASRCGGRLLWHFFRRDSASSMGTVMLSTFAELFAGGGFFSRSAMRTMAVVEPRIGCELERYSFHCAELYFRFLLGQGRGDFDESLVRFYLRRGDFGRINFYLSMWGHLLIREGRQAEAREVMRRELEISEDYGNRDTLCSYLDNLALFSLARGEAAEAEAAARKLLALGEELGEGAYRALHLSYLADALMQREAFEEAEKVVVEMKRELRGKGLEPPIQNLAPFISALRWHCLEAGREREGQSRLVALDLARPYCRRMFAMCRTYAYLRPEALRVAGGYYRLCGKRRKALVCLKRGLETAKELGLEPEVVLIETELAKLG